MCRKGKKMRSMFFILLFSQSAFSMNQDICDPNKPQQIIETEDLEEIMTKVDFDIHKTISFKNKEYETAGRTQISQLKTRITSLIEKYEGKTIRIDIKLNMDIGSDIDASIKFVRFVRDLNKSDSIQVNTRVQSKCNSACSIMFTAGERRFAKPRLRFGFHKPTFRGGDKNGESRSDIEERYRQKWYRSIGEVDSELATRLEQEDYLKNQNFRYIRAEDINTGFVTDYL